MCFMHFCLVTAKVKEKTKISEIVSFLLEEATILSCFSSDLNFGVFCCVFFLHFLPYQTERTQTSTFVVTRARFL